MNETQFWAALRVAWDTRPLEVIPSPLPLGVSEDDVWTAVISAGSGAAATGVSITTALDDQADRDAGSWVRPAPEDKDLDAYLHRVDQRAAGRSWSCAFSGLHRVSAPLWDRAAHLSEQIAENLEARPLGRSDVDIFMGHYPATTVGIHQDFAHNLSFTMRGPKRLVTWPPALGDRLPRKSLDYADVRAQATILNGTPGGMTYFPPDEYHIGESPDAATAALNVVFFEVRHTTDEALLPIRSLLDIAPQPRSKGDGSTMDPAGITTAFEQISAALSNGTAQRIAVSRWLRSLTSFRLDVARPTTEPIATADAVRLRSGARLLYADDPASDDSLLFSADGNVGAVRKTSSGEKFLDALAGGSVVDGSEWPSDCRPMYEELLGWGAITHS